MVHNLNNEGQPPAEFVEKRPKAEGNTGQATVIDTQGSKEASSALSRVREAAKRDSKLQFSNLLHHVNIDLLRQSYLALITHGVKFISCGMPMISSWVFSTDQMRSSFRQN